MAPTTEKARQKVRTRTDPEISADLRAMDEQIRLRAYEIWLEHEGRNGSDVADWLQAENEILNR